MKNKIKEQGVKQPGCKDLQPGCFTAPNTFFEEIKDKPKLVEIFCYCLNPNHYHLILKQIKENGVEIFMRKLGIGYAKYFNSKYKHSGVLFQSRFKAFPINNENKLCQLSAYVNCNYEIHKLSKAIDWKFSSYQDYLNLRKGNLCNKNIVLELFSNDLNRYKNYCELVIKESQKIKEDQKIFLE